MIRVSCLGGKVIKRRMEVMSRKNRIIISFVEECGYEGTGQFLACSGLILDLHG